MQGWQSRQSFEIEIETEIEIGQSRSRNRNLDLENRNLDLGLSRSRSDEIGNFFKSIFIRGDPYVEIWSKSFVTKNRIKINNKEEITTYGAKRRHFCTFPLIISRILTILEEFIF